MLDSLAKISPYDLLDEKGQQSLAQVAMRRSYRRNRVIIRQGDDSNTMFVLLEGEMKVYVEDDQGKQLTVRILKPGDSFGEVALIGDFPRTASVVSLTDCVVYAFSRGKYLAFLKAHPEILLALSKTLANMVRDTTEELSSIALSIFRGMDVHDAFEGLVDGIKGVTIGAIILGLAVTLAMVSDKLGASTYIIEATSEFLSAVPYVLPGVLMIICMFVSFSVGSSWGTYAVVFPIALPLAYAISPDPLYVTLAFGAIMGGAVFGDQCSPISDTTILSSLACGSDLMDHVVTQLPIAMAAAGISILIYTATALALTL